LGIRDDGSCMIFAVVTPLTEDESGKNLFFLEGGT